MPWFNIPRLLIYLFSIETRRKKYEHIAYSTNAERARDFTEQLTLKVAGSALLCLLYPLYHVFCAGVESAPCFVGEETRGRSRTKKVGVGSKSPYQFLYFALGSGGERRDVASGR